ncbi:hypothetical protein EVAR_4737_1 [Eumeta japonica]|uniref:Uncharacterized protein n=1 Tax=Eumeta variegata TaxID=151549 RepID=A0A4C1SZF5_EUMVA|nr:hypothetical protein EVAR_4737_1 [Eumeta japonica]
MLLLDSEAPCLNTAKHGYAEFNDGRVSLHNEIREGHPQLRASRNMRLPSSGHLKKFHTSAIRDLGAPRNEQLVICARVLAPRRARDNAPGAGGGGGAGGRPSLR